MARILEGAGGDSGPTNTEDNLLSTDAIEVVLGISEGPIKGIVGDLADDRKRNTLVGDTPLVDAEGKTNFDDFVVAYYNGTQSDTPIEFLLGGATSNHTNSLPVTLATSTPVTRTWVPPADPTVTTLVEIRIQVNQLYHSGEDGTTNNTVRFQLAYRTSAGGAWRNWDQNAPGAPTVQTLEITGKTTGGYVKEYATLLPGLAAGGHYEFRVTKITAINNTKDFRDITWESFQTSTPGTASFPNVALLHIKGKASNQFNSVPDFSGVFDGWEMRVPSNYNPVLRTYTGGAWNGTFYANPTYTNNPAWALYNLITDERLGLAAYYKNVAANRYAFYKAGRWCDELVPDGQGGFQPRFTFNELITQQRNGLELLQFIAGAFNSVLFDDGNGTVHLRTDQYVAPLQIFTPENISEEGFSYSYSDISTRANSITVSFVNPDLGWNDDRRIIEDAALIAANGRIPLDFIAVGCTNVHEATRRARYRLVTANTEVASVTFTTNRLGMLTALFDSIYIADPDSNWSFPGRVKSIVGNVVNLRDPIFFTSTAPVTMKIQTAATVTVEGGGSAGSFLLTDVTVVPPGVGLQSSFTKTAGAFPSNMPAKVVFTLHGSTFGLPKPFKVMSIEETSEGGRAYQVTALEINVNKYSDVDGGTTSVPVPYSYVEQEYPLSVTNLGARSGDAEIRRNSQTGVVESFIFLYWTVPEKAFTEYFEVTWQEKGTGVWRTEKVYGTSTSLGPVKTGARYNMQVVSVSPKNTRSSPVALNNHLVANLLLSPQGVVGVATSGLFSVKLDWTFLGLATDLQGTEVWWSTINNRAGAVKLDTVAYPARTYVHAGLNPGEGGYYWLRTINRTGVNSPWYPLDAVGGLFALSSTDTSALLDFFNDSLGIPQLTADFQAGLELIDVNAELALLHDSFLTSIGSSMISAEALLRGTAIIETKTLITTGDAQLAQLITTLTAVVGDNAAMLQTELTTRANADSAESTARLALQATVQTEDTALQALVLAEQTARASGDSAEATARLALQTTVGDNLALLQSEQTARADGDAAEATSRLALGVTLQAADATLQGLVSTESTARANGDSVEATARGLLAAQVQTDNLALQAMISTEQTARANGDTAEATARGLLATSVANNTAAIQTETSTRSTAVGAVATSVEQVQARLDTGDYAAVKTQSSTSANKVAGIEARWSVMLDVNGRVTGLQLLNNGTTSSFVVLSDKFLFLGPDGAGTPIPLLTMGPINGVNTLGLNGNMLIDGTAMIKTANIENANITTLKIAGNAIGASNFASGSNTASTAVSIPPNVTARCLVIVSSTKSNSTSNAGISTLTLGGSLSASTTASDIQDLSSEFAGYMSPPMQAFSCGDVTSGAGGATVTASASFSGYLRSAGVTVALFVNWK